MIAGFPHSGWFPVARPAAAVHQHGESAGRPSILTGLNFFYVKERFLFFTQWVAIPLGTPAVVS